MNFMDGKNFKDMLGLWGGLPGKFTEHWMRLARNFTPSQLPFPFMKKDEEQRNLPFDSLNMYEEWMKMTGETVRKVLDMAPSGGVGPETYNKVFDGMKAYFSLYEFWNSWTRTMGPMSGKSHSPEEWKAAQEKLSREYVKVLDSVIGRKPPDSMEEILKIQGKMMGQGLEALSWFKSPWSIMMKRGPQVASKAATGDISSVREGFSLWQTAISDTIGKLLQIPSLGYSREYEERNKELVEAYVRYATALPAFYSEFYQTGMNAFDQLMEKTKEVPTDNSPESFKRFYGIWVRVNEDAFFDLFKRDEFSGMMNEVMNRGLDFKKKLDRNTSKYLESISVPNRQEMDDVYKALYDLKREVRKLGREVRDLREKLDK